MKIEMQKIKLKELVEGYLDSQDNGVVAFHGLLNVRPAFQREFIYKDEQRNEVMRTVNKNFPLNVMYWSVSENPNNVDISTLKSSEDILKSGIKFELMDGQQRTISICQYMQGDYSVLFDKSQKNPYSVSNLTQDEKNRLLDYDLSIYICEGTDSEKLDWFKIINIAGEVLTAQEMRNAIYTGKWLSCAKSYFSKNGCTAYKIAQNYLNGTSIRQDYLETALSWISNKEKISIEQYMSNHQQDENADELISYFKAVIAWVNTVFPTPKGSKPRKEMKGLSWGIFYNKYSSNFKTSLEDKVAKYMADEDVMKKSGIYEYLLSGDEKHLNIREFKDSEKRTAYEKQKGICMKCGKHFEFEEMEGDHITPWSQGGKTVLENLYMLCKECNRRKSDK